MLGRRGLSPIVATVLLIGITVAAAAPLATFFSGMYAPVRPRRTDVQVFVGLINENVIRIHIQHIGGQTINDPLDPDEGVRGTVAYLGVSGADNTIYCWTFEKPDRFRVSDWGHAEAQIHNVGLNIGDTISINIWASRVGTVYNGAVIIDNIITIPG